MKGKQNRDDFNTIYVIFFYINYFPIIQPISIFTRFKSRVLFSPKESQEEKWKLTIEKNKNQIYRERSINYITPSCVIFIQNKVKFQWHRWTKRKQNLGAKPATEEEIP